MSIDRIRYAPEKKLIESLFERFNLDDMVDNFRATEHAPHYQMVLSTQLRLTPVLAPRLTNLLGEVASNLEFTDPVELFVHADPNINAFAMQTPGEGMPHVVSLTSSLVERMTDDEIRFVIGHELGHLRFDHHRPRMAWPAFGEDEQNRSRMPKLLQRRLQVWDRLSELSADRAGFAAVHGSINPVVSAFFKMQSGLGPEHLSFDVEVFLTQLEELQRMKRPEILARFSHPITPVRVRALQLYGEAGGLRANADTLTQLDQQIAEVARLMDFEVTDDMDVHARDFIVAGGLIATNADGKVHADEFEMLVDMLVPLSADPEAHLQKIETIEQATEMLDRSIAWLRENGGPAVFQLYAQLCHLACADGRLVGEEKAFLTRVAEGLGIPAKQANQAMYDVLANYNTGMSNRLPLMRSLSDAQE